MSPGELMNVETAAGIARRVRDEGGRALVVGGWVRDKLMDRPSKDLDLEVYGLPADRVMALLTGH